MSSLSLNSKSRAELFFEEIVSKEKRAFAFLEKIAQPEAATDENEWREFKEAKQLTAPLPEDKKAVREKNDANLKQIWSKCLGAFTNSGGGVLIWGIKAPDRKAEGVSLVHDAPQLAERLIQWATDALDPPLRGIRVEAITKSASIKEGFVVCLVPESALKPHRSRWSENEFYLRLQDGSKPCPMSLLRSLFHPNLAPRLATRYMLKLEPPREDRVSVCLSVAVENTGSMTAHELIVQAHSKNSLNSLFEFYPERAHGWAKVPHTNWKFASPEPLHPGQLVRIGRFQGWSAGISPPRELRVTTVIYARNMVPHDSFIEFTGDELDEAFRSGKEIQRLGSLGDR
ncbi:ATP-binding protein [Prosthecobacter sp.]|uniref:AlbA family DNA-binding domain-containing protein n=1 Tax=Prosthecobacter sp. TaxID=1965333 RepID=UPI002AB87826|nr:ATP-binding protein [Prosthecobacter sp.]MDZ4401333.1 ATP-binding protein [Prosthecobacter sp.]